MTWKEFRSEAWIWVGGIILGLLTVLCVAWIAVSLFVTIFAP